MRSALVCFGLLAGAACAAPRDTTPLIRVDPKAARRLDWIARTAPAEPKSGAARVHAMKAGEELGGPNAIGRPGDWLLENDEVAFVIDHLGSSAGFAESGGNIVDAADARVRKDELGQVFAYFGKFPRQGVYDTISTGRSPDGSAWVEARGRELYEPTLLVTTRYTLHAPDRALLIETTLENTGADPVDGLSLGDAIQWGGAEKIAPGKTRGFKGASSGPYVGGVGRFTSYAITSTRGTVDATSGGTWTDTAQRRDVKLAPREKTSYARIFIVGERADTSSLVSELALSAGQPVGAVDLSLLPTDGEWSVDVPSDARVSIQNASGAEVMTLQAAGAPPRLEGLLPPGSYVLSYAGGGGRAGRAPVPLEVHADGVTHADVPVTRAAGVRVLCRGPLDATEARGEATPCKVTFERTDGGSPPDFGVAYAAGPARHQVTTSDGVIDVPLAWGAYRVTASRGPEYSLAQTDLTLAPGEETEVRLSPRRVVDTLGYLACDFHQHTMLGTDAPVATRDRIISNVAEGVEAAVASEHNVVADLEPIVRALHLERRLVSISGDELTSDASRHPWGHANAWPLPFRPDDPRGGAPAVRDRTPRQVFDELRSKVGADFVLQVEPSSLRSERLLRPARLRPEVRRRERSRIRRRLRRARGVEWSERRSTREGARRFFRVASSWASRNGDRRYGHARHRGAGGRLPADVRARRG